MHFLTNTCQLFITNSAHVVFFKLVFCLTSGLRICFVYLLFYPENCLKTNEVTKVICSQVARVQPSKHHRKDVYKALHFQKQSISLDVMRKFEHEISDVSHQ